MKDEKVKWTELKHNGVIFPPPYSKLPSGVKVKYEGKSVSLDNSNINNPFNVTAEEAALFFAQKLEQDKRIGEKNKLKKRVINDPKFLDNFWKDWKVILGKGHPIKDFKKVDFSSLINHIVSSAENKKARTKEEKVEEKENKEEIRRKYGYAYIDGKKISIGNYLIQPPGLYIGHGDHPKRGMIKKRIMPSDVTLNISKKYAPECINHGKPCKWGKIVENKDVTWIASWKHPITGESNYVWLKREESHFVTADDKIKFDKARSLQKNIEKVRALYTKDMKSSDKNTRQLGTAVYLLDKLSIRPGTDKDEENESGTLGLTTLKCSNIKFDGGNKVTFDFIGKSSIQLLRQISVTEIVYKNLKELCKTSSKKEIFPDVNASSLNAYLKTLLPDLTSKVFRTWKASSILQEELNKNIPDNDEPTHTKKLVYDKVNIAAAKALNHKKMDSSDARIKKIKDKIAELKIKKKDAATDKAKATVQKSIEIAESKLVEAEENISIATSKINYIDPRIVVSWAKKIDMPIEKIYNKQALKKFLWAMNIDPEWKF